MRFGQERVAPYRRVSRELPASPQGTFRTISQVNETIRIISYASVPGYPLVVTIGISVAEALDSWYRQVALTVLVFAAFLGLFLFITWQLIQRLESDEARRRANQRRVYKKSGSASSSAPRAGP